MNVLAIDCTRKAVTVAVKKKGKWFSCDAVAAPASVSVNCAIEKVLSEARLKYAAIDVYCCNVGPGSFTGIRVSVAAIKGLNFGFEKKIISVNTFELAAYNTQEAKEVLVPDNRGYFCAKVENGATVSLPEHIDFADKKLTGDEIVFDENGDWTQALQIVCDRKIENGEFSQDFTPLYIRKSQAEELHGKR